MTAVIPPAVVNAASVVLAIAAILGAVGAVSRLPPSKWIWKQLVGQPLSKWFQEQATTAVETITKQLVDPKIETLVGEQQTIRQTIDAIDERTLELKSNGGGSLADTVIETATKVANLEGAMVEAVAQRAHTDERVAELDAKVTVGVTGVMRTEEKLDELSQAQEATHVVVAEHVEADKVAFAELHNILDSQAIITRTLEAQDVAAAIVKADLDASKPVKKHAAKRPTKRTPKKGTT